eukprot:jgi/Mesvir1/11673/Mv00067-RA.1
MARNPPLFSAENTRVAGFLDEFSKLLPANVMHAVQGMVLEPATGSIAYRVPGSSTAYYCPPGGLDADLLGALIANALNRTLSELHTAARRPLDGHHTGAVHPHGMSTHMNGSILGGTDPGLVTPVLTQAFDMRVLLSALCDVLCAGMTSERNDPGRHDVPRDPSRQPLGSLPREQREENSPCIVPQAKDVGRGMARDVDKDIDRDMETTSSSADRGGLRHRRAAPADVQHPPQGGEGDRTLPQGGALGGARDNAVVLTSSSACFHASAVLTTRCGEGDAGKKVMGGQDDKTNGVTSVASISSMVSASSSTNVSAASFDDLASAPAGPHDGLPPSHACDAASRAEWEPSSAPGASLPPMERKTSLLVEGKGVEVTQVERIMTYRPVGTGASTSFGIPDAEHIAGLLWRRYEERRRSGLSEGHEGDRLLIDMLNCLRGEQQLRQSAFQLQLQAEANALAARRTAASEESTNLRRAREERRSAAEAAQVWETDAYTSLCVALLSLLFVVTVAIWDRLWKIPGYCDAVVADDRRKREAFAARGGSRYHASSWSLFGVPSLGEMVPESVSHGAYMAACCAGEVWSVLAVVFMLALVWLLASKTRLLEAAPGKFLFGAGILFIPLGREIVRFARGHEDHWNAAWFALLAVYLLAYVAPSLWQWVTLRLIRQGPPGHMWAGLREVEPMHFEGHGGRPAYQYHVLPGQQTVFGNGLGPQGQTPHRLPVWLQWVLWLTWVLVLPVMTSVLPFRYQLRRLWSVLLTGFTPFG